MIEDAEMTQNEPRRLKLNLTSVGISHTMAFN